MRDIVEAFFGHVCFFHTQRSHPTLLQALGTYAHILAERIKGHQSKNKNNKETRGSKETKDIKGSSDKEITRVGKRIKQDNAVTLARSQSYDM